MDLNKKEDRCATTPSRDPVSVEFCAAGLGSSLIIPLKTNIQTEDAFPIRVRVPKGTCGLEKESEALIDQILAWDVTLFEKDSCGPLAW